MLQLVLATIRGRAVSFIGTTVAVALATAMIAAAGILIDSRARVHVTTPTRLGAVSLVIQSDQRPMSGRSFPAAGTVAGPHGDVLTEQRRVPATLLDRARAVPGVRAAVGDLSFYAQLVDSHGHPLSGPLGAPSLGHGWSSAILTPFTLRAGRAPAAPDEVVLDADLARRDGVHVGDRVQVLSAADHQQFVVTGIAAPPGGDGLSAESSLFFGDAAVPQLSGIDGSLDAIGVFAGPGVDVKQLNDRLRNALDTSGIVLQSPAELGHQESAAAVANFNSAISFVITLGIIAAFVAIFVAANTFAISILQRTREIALLRAIGTTTRQVTGLLVAESLVVTLFASLIGCVAGSFLAAAIAPAFSQAGLAPPGFQATPTALPLVLAALGGIVVGVLSVLVAARRAARIKPTQALLEAAVEPALIAPARMAFGLLGVVGGVALVSGVLPLRLPDTVTIVLGTLALSAGVAWLSPLLAVPAGWLLGGPLSKLSPVTGLLARFNTVANPRRTASAAAPLMLTVTIGCTLLFGSTTRTHIEVERAARSLHSQFVLVAPGGDGLPAGLAAAAGRLPGVAAASGVVGTVVIVPPGGGAGPAQEQSALGIDTQHASGGLTIATQGGSLADLSGNTMAARADQAAANGWQLGSPVQLWLADGAPATLQLVAIYQNDASSNDVLLPRPLAAQHTHLGLDQAVYVQLAPGADAGAVGARLATLTHQYPTAQVASRDAYLTQISTPSFQDQIPLYILTGLVVIYTAIAIVNTLIMATAERAREFALLRLVGTTRWQVVRMIGWEALIIVAMGVLLGSLIPALGLATLSRNLSGAVDVTIDPLTYAAIVGGCAFLGFAASLLPASLAIRTRPIDAIGIHE